MHINRRVAALAYAVAVTLVAGGCGKNADVTGKWTGPLDLGPYIGVTGKPADTTIHIALDIRQGSNGLTATMTREDES